jgi:hypothetical protein
MDSRGTGIRLSAVAKDFSLLHGIQTDSKANPTSYATSTGAIPLRIKRLGRYAGQSPPSSVEVNNGGAISPLLLTSS